MIYADRRAGIIVAGATGRQGAFHIALMNEYAAGVGGTGGREGRRSTACRSTTVSGTRSRSMTQR